MEYKIIDRKKAGDKTSFGAVIQQQYDDSLTLHVIMDNNHLYPSDILKTIKDQDIIYYFGTSTLIKRTKKKKKYVATYCRKKPVW